MPGCLDLCYHPLTLLDTGKVVNDAGELNRHDDTLVALHCVCRWSADASDGHAAVAGSNNKHPP